MSYQHVENLLIRYRGQAVDIKTISGGVYEGIVNDVTNNYVALKVRDASGGDDVVFVLLHAVESVLPQRSN
jgi:ferredoxin-fold anticodon binding domain-containing protein